MLVRANPQALADDSFACPCARPVQQRPETAAEKIARRLDPGVVQKSREEVYRGHELISHYPCGHTPLPLQDDRCAKAQLVERELPARSVDGVAERLL